MNPFDADFADLIPKDSGRDFSADFADLLPKDTGRDFSADFADLTPAAPPDTASRGYQAEVRKAEGEPIDRPARMTLTRGGQPKLEASTEPTFTREADWSTVVESLPAQLVGGTESMVANVREMLGKDAIKYIKNELAGPRVGPEKRAYYERMLAEAEKETPERSAAAAKAREITASITPPDMTTLQKGLSMFVQSAPSTLAAVVTGVLTRSPQAAMAVGGLGGFTQQAAQTYGEAIVKGATHEVAKRSAAIQGAIELFDAVPIGIALKPGSAFLKRLTATMIAEPLTEGAQQALQDLEAHLSYDPNMTLGEAWENVKIAMVAGAIGGAVYTAGGHAMEKSRFSAELGQVVKDIEATDVTAGTELIAIEALRPENAQLQAVEVSTPKTVAPQQTVPESVAEVPTPAEAPPAVQAAPGATPEAGVVAEPQPEAARANEPVAAPSRLEDIPAELVIHEPTLVEETGETVNVERNAREAFKEADQRVNRYRALIECLGGAA